MPSDDDELEDELDFDDDDFDDEVFQEDGYVWSHNDPDGKSFTIERGGNLDCLPPEAQELLTPEIRAIYQDPTDFLTSLRQRSPLPNMKRYFAELLQNDFVLRVHQTTYFRGRAELSWQSQTVHSAAIVPPLASRPKQLLPILDDYYSVVDLVAWLGFNVAGGLESCEDHSSPPDYFPFSLDVPREATRIIGWSFCGDMLIYTLDDCAGWLSHETGEVRVLGTVAEMLNWVYGELLANRCPDCIE